MKRLDRARSITSRVPPVWIFRPGTSQQRALSHLSPVTCHYFRTLSFRTVSLWQIVCTKLPSFVSHSFSSQKRARSSSAGPSYFLRKTNCNNVVSERFVLNRGKIPGKFPENSHLFSRKTGIQVIEYKLLIPKFDRKDHAFRCVQNL